jgi:hypothetical protein
MMHWMDFPRFKTFCRSFGGAELPCGMTPADSIHVNASVPFLCFLFDEGMFPGSCVANAALFKVLKLIMFYNNFVIKEIRKAACYLFSLNNLMSSTNASPVVPNIFGKAEDGEKCL